MGAKVVFMRRTPKEIEIFGGEVFIDIDGKNIGKLSLQDFSVQLENGLHKVKMYKSHTYDTYIGVAEAEFEVTHNNDLLIKYSPPMLVNQPGTLIVSDYQSPSQVDSIVYEKERKLDTDLKVDEQKRTEIEEMSHRGLIIFIVIMVIVIIIYIIEISTIYNY